MKDIITNLIYGISPNLILVKAEKRCGSKYAVYTTKNGVPDKKVTDFMTLNNLRFFLRGVLQSDSFMEKLNGK